MGIIALGFEATRGQIDTLFDELDADGSGSIEYKELQHAVRGVDPSTKVHGQKGNILRKHSSSAKLLEQEEF